MAGSRRRSGQYNGRGFLNLSKEVMVIPRNLNDPNGFYRLLEVPPWATEDEIRKGYRKMSKRFHPDGVTPDTEKFLLVSQAYKILTERRDEYNILPPGVRWRMAGEEGMEKSEVDSILAGARREESPKGYSYYYEDGESHEVAQRWYEVLREELPAWGYTGRVAIKLGSRVNIGRRRIEVPYIHPNPPLVFVVAISLMSAKITGTS